MIGERIKQIRSQLSMTQKDLSAILGITKSALCLIENERYALSKRNRDILLRELNINPGWLDYGKGEMFLEGNTSGQATKSSLSITPPESVPLFSIEKSGGVKDFFSNKERIAISYILFYGMPQCDGAIYAPDDSMYPLIQNKDIILFKDMKDAFDIVSGEVYIVYLRISKEDHLLVRYLKEDPQNDGMVIISSFNSKYPEQKVSKGSIMALARVQGHIHINTSL